MGSVAFLASLWASANPVLPTPAAMQAALYLGWAVVLGCGVLLALRRVAPPYRWGLALLVACWTLVPGVTSPAYWLGLAFQAPSLMSVVVCLAWLVGGGMQQRSGHPRATPLLAGSWPLGAAGVALGWVLLLDTLACFPVSVYAWGFNSALMAVLAGLASTLWLLAGAAAVKVRAAESVAALLILLVLALFVLTRLPTGNVWDALMDPGLWLALQLGWLVSALRCLARAGWRRSATRA